MAASNEESHNEGIMTAINITPFVDVVLVLLVIFMVTAPMLVKDILELRLPKTKTGDGQMMQTLGVAVNKDGNILLNGQLTDEAGLSEATKLSLAENPQAQALISADKEASYGKVVKVIDILKTAGLEKFAVQIEREEKKP
ncbi:MAG: biopolymer transporter ExbD [Deltaproteobacteria bacterium]|jgi:biopolymer transport protein ExbD|nr:biopolymer transporter ExbD [Deltaproteobacteria bacterium]